MTDQDFERERRIEMLEEASKPARNDLAALLNLAEWLRETNGAAYMCQSIARAHGKRMMEVAQTLDLLIRQQIEARMSKWDMEDKRRELELEIARLKFERRHGRLNPAEVNFDR